MRLRQGRRVPNHLYEQFGPEPTDDDPPVGFITDPALAAILVRAFNAEHARHEGNALAAFGEDIVYCRWRRSWHAREGCSCHGQHDPVPPPPAPPAGG